MPFLKYAYETIRESRNKSGHLPDAGNRLICTLIIIFGEVPDLFKPTYALTVEFPDASGLLKGSMFTSPGNHRQGDHRPTLHAG